MSSAPSTAQSPTSDKQPPACPPHALPSSRWRWALSVLILLHAWAVLGEPVAFMTRTPMSIEGSPAGEAFQWPVKAYGEFLYMNHGYAFFAPDPGPSHLMEVRYAHAGQDPTIEVFPDLQRQWPRLLYHRHFMLSEFLHNVHMTPVPPELQQDSSTEVADWRITRRQFEAIRDSFRRHLADRADLDVERVSIARIEHRAPFVPEYLLDSVRLRDARLYAELPDELGPLPGGALLDRPLPPNAGASVPEWTPLGVPQREPAADAPSADTPSEQPER